MSLDQAALEIGVTMDDLHRWSRVQWAEPSLIVPVQVEDESTVRREIVVVVRSGVRVEGLTVAEVADLLRRLS